uniref:Uncharacterized protein n=1 Tax=Anguilla anguilla TaxID=7936 RepID=A0A0E9SHA0_ANGAN
MPSIFLKNTNKNH